MKKVLKVINGVIRGILVAVCLALCAYNIYMLIARYAWGNQMPTVFGFAGAEVVSPSMDDGNGDDIEVGDFIVVQAQDDYVIDDVITFYDAQRGMYVTHRIIFADENGYTTKGDANPSPDPEIVQRAQVVGKVVWVIKGAGTALDFLRSPTGLLVVILAGAAVWVGADVISRIADRQKNGTQSED